jgi:CelD/BcsL family acetyltransferase involved in cellulose biosynthesis
MLKVLEIRSLPQLEDIRDAWEDLHARLANASLFLSYSWFYICAKNLASHEGTLLVLTVQDGDRLIGIAPLVEKRTTVRGFPLRQIAFLDTPLTPFSDFLLLEPDAAIRAITHHLLETCNSWDLLSLGKFKGDSPTLGLLSSVLIKSSCQVHTREVARTPFLALVGKWEDFYQAKSRKFRMTRRSVANRLKRLGAILVERVTSAADAGVALEAMLSVSARGWKRGEGRDLLTPEFERRFLTDLTCLAARKGWLNIWLLKHENNVLAAEYHLNDCGTIYGLRAQYDQAYEAYSPGRYLDYEIVEQLFRDGFKCYDMGPGAAEYKLSWTDDIYSCHTIEAYKPAPYPNFVYRLQHVWIPGVKRSRLGKWMANRSSSPVERN